MRHSKAESKDHCPSDSYLNPRDVKDTVQNLYREFTGAVFYKQVMRPYICPFHRLVDEVPKGSNVLDIGCGSGLFLGLLASRKGIRKSIGFDADESAINMAKKMASTLDGAELLTFEHCDVQASWPDGLFDVVSLIDVIHHIPPHEQINFLKLAIEKLAPKGIFLYKDMVENPFYRAWPNRLHDLIIARQWINYLPMDEVKSVAKGYGLKILKEGEMNMFWYGHEWTVFRKGNS